MFPIPKGALLDIASRRGPIINALIIGTGAMKVARFSLGFPYSLFPKCLFSSGWGILVFAFILLPLFRNSARCKSELL
jgi:hypothetical protein